MIRKHAGDRFLLFTQNDHALLSGQCARHYGNARFAPPEPAEDVLAAVSMHDSGWPLHDDEPSLNKDGVPLNVFETPLPLALRIWTRSSEHAARHGSDYTQLLVSLHGLGLSGFAASNAHTRHEMFELNKFQQQEIERQETLRRRLRLRTDIPLRLGLAEGVAPAAEQQLRRNHYLLQIMDRLSLALCSTEIPFPKVENITPRPAADVLSISFRRAGERAIMVDPWPFNQPSLEFEIPCRSLPARRYESEAEFREAYAGAAIEQVRFYIRARR